MVSGPILFSSVRFSHVQLFVTLWIAACQASLSITNSQSSPKLIVPLLYGKYMDIQWKQWENLFSWAPKSLQMVTAAMKLKDACSWKISYDQPRQHIKKQRQYLANKGPSSQSYGFSSSHVWMWELDYK